MKCLVIGASGYLGRHLSATLLAAGHQVVAVSRSGDFGLAVDIDELTRLRDLDWEVDSVFLFAGLTGTTVSFDEYQSFVSANQIGQLNVLECIRKSGHRPRVVFPSTRLVYKGSTNPLPETAEFQAKTVYAASKIACELQLQAYAAAFDIPYTVFRICVPYGNSQGGRYSYGTIGSFIQQSHDNGVIRLYGDGSLRRTFTHVDDICRSILLGSARKDFENDIFNVPGDDLSLLEAAELIASRLGASVEMVAWPEFDFRIESGSTVFDAAKLSVRLPTFRHRAMCEWVSSIARQLIK